MNKNYEAGRRVEYSVIKSWKEQGYSCIRASGSKGLYDLIAFRVDRKPEMVQCKRVSTPPEANRLANKFRNETMPSSFYHQSMAIQVKGSTQLITITV